MPSPIYFRTLSRLCILCILGICLWIFVTKANPNAKQYDSHINVTAKQLPKENGVYPVEIRCEAVPLAAPNAWNGFSCKLKNNTSKKITATNFTYSIIFADADGVIKKDTHSLIFETLIDPDFPENNNSIAPGAEEVIGPMGKVSYENDVIKGIEVGVDYVEFEDGTTSGANKNGFKNIVDMRQGVRKYRDWLIKRYKELGNSVNNISALLDKDQPLPNLSGELQFKNSFEENGARAYQTRLRKIRDNGGEGLAKYLEKILNRKPRS